MDLLRGVGSLPLRGRVVEGTPQGARMGLGRGGGVGVTPQRTHESSEGVSPEVKEALKSKRVWEEDTVDDLEIDDQATSRSASGSRSSYNTRRQRAWRANSKAASRSAARLRDKPAFQHISVTLHEDFYRHYKRGFQFAKPDPFVMEFVDTFGPPTPYCKPAEICFLTACDDVEMNHLKHFDRPPRDLNPKFIVQYQHALVAVEQMMTIPHKLRFPHSEDLEEVKYKAKKFPGAHYRARGYQTRGEAQEQALVDAKLAFAQLLDDQHVEPHAVRLGGRGKALTKSQAAITAAKKPKGRLILMLSQRDLLLCGVTEQLLTDAYCPDEYPVSIGMGWFKRNVTRFAERYAPYKKFFCMDAAKFDSSLDPYMVQDVLDILRRQFRHGQDPKYDRYWAFVLESLISAPVQRDDGWTMHKNCGTTSGHNHNTLVQSVCSLIIGYTVYLALCPQESPNAVINDVAIETLGDDNLTGTLNMMTSLSVDDVADVAEEIFGQDYTSDKSFATDLLFDTVSEGEAFTEDGKFQGVQYLGKFLRSYVMDVEGKKVTTALPYRPVLETFVHMYYPERRGVSLERTYQRALGNLLDNYGNPLAATWLNKLLDWLEPKLDLLPTDWFEDTVQDAARDYTRKAVRVPRPMRWSFDEWVGLCLTEDDSDPDWFMYA